MSNLSVLNFRNDRSKASKVRPLRSSAVAFQ
jgi:hypothetical protein